MVAGIFETSIRVARGLTSNSTFGIVTTGSYWVENLTNGVSAILGGLSGFEAVESTGLNANELHTADHEEVKKKVKDATKRLLRGNCTVICLGCAGMTGMDSWVGEAISETGKTTRDVRVIDGVRAALAHLTAAKYRSSLEPSHQAA
jgi:Asp/Glu/hydantoin racemase